MRTLSRDGSYLALLKCLQKYIQADVYLKEINIFEEADECCRVVHNSLNFYPFVLQRRNELKKEFEICQKVKKVGTPPSPV